MKTASQFLAGLLLSSSVLATETNQLQSLHISGSVFPLEKKALILDTENKVREIISPVEQLRYELYQSECFEKENDKIKAKIFRNMLDAATGVVQLTVGEVIDIESGTQCHYNSPKLPEGNHFFITSDNDDFYMGVADEQTIQTKAFQDALHQCNILNGHKVYTLYPLKIDSSSPLITKISAFEWNLPTNQILCDDENQNDEQEKTK